MSWHHAIFYCMHAPMACFQNALTYFVTVVSYACKMFLKLTTGLEGDQCWTASSGLPRCQSHKSLSLCSGQNKLECLSWVCQVRLINLHQKSWQHLGVKKNAKTLLVDPIVVCLGRKGFCIVPKTLVSIPSLTFAALPSSWQVKCRRSDLRVDIRMQYCKHWFFVTKLKQ